MISIVLPTYNGEKYIEESIQSILKQTYKDFELIIVDDCSTDSTSKIIQEYKEKDSRITVLTNTNNMKLPASLNIGFQQAKGNFFTWTSDDNLYKEDAFQKMIQILEKYRNIDIVYCGYNYINENGEKTGRFDGYISNIDELYFGNYIGACFLYKKEVHFILGGYDTELYLAEDYDFWLRAYEKYKFYYINEYLYDYRLHENTLTSTKKDQINTATIKLIKKVIKTSKCNKLIKCRLCLMLVRKYEIKNNRGKALVYFIKANIFCYSRAKKCNSYLKWYIFVGKRLAKYFSQ